MCFMEFQASEKYRNVLCVWLVGHHTCECVKSIPWKSCPVCHQIPSSVGSWRIPYVSHRSSLWIILMFSGKEFPQLCTPLKLFFFHFFPPFPRKFDESTVLYLNLMVTYLGLDPKVPGFRELLKPFPGIRNVAVPSFLSWEITDFGVPTSGNLGTDTTKNPTK